MAFVSPVACIYWLTFWLTGINVPGCSYCVHMRIHLDANAWIKLFADSELYSQFLNRYLVGQMDLGLTQQIVDELTTAAEEKNPEIARYNLERLKPFMKKIEQDGIFIIGFSRLDKAKFATEQLDSLYSIHLERKDLNKHNVRDGIHLVNASQEAANLITCDKAVIKTSKNEGISTTCFGTFIRVQDLKDLPDCSSWISLDNITLSKPHSG